MARVHAAQTEREGDEVSAPIYELGQRDLIPPINQLVVIGKCQQIIAARVLRRYVMCVGATARVPLRDTDDVWQIDLELTDQKHLVRPARPEPKHLDRAQRGILIERWERDRDH